MAVAPVGAGDVIVPVEGLADADSHGLFAAVEMGQTGHFCAQIEFIRRVLEGANFIHLLVDVEPLFGVHRGIFCHCFFSFGCVDSLSVNSHQ